MDLSKAFDCQPNNMCIETLGKRRYTLIRSNDAHVSILLRKQCCVLEIRYFSQFEYQLNL